MSEALEANPAESHEDRLYGLIEVAERQQVVAQTTLDLIVQERSASVAERQWLAEQIDGLNGALRAAVVEAVGYGMANTVEQRTDAIKSVTDHLLGAMADISARANDAADSLRTLARWASWRLLGRAGLAVAGLAILWWLALGAVLWWDTSAIGAAQLRKSQLHIEIAEMQANAESWKRAGMLGKIARCGPKKRPCVRIDETAGAFGEGGDFRTILGTPD